MTATEVWDTLRRVVDPEYPVSVVDLGIVYDVRVADGVVDVDLTFTSIGCPAVEMIPEDIREAVSALAGVEAVRVNIVWDPPWTKDRISDQGRRILQLYGVVA